jgi:hypothetical protein
MIRYETIRPKRRKKKLEPEENSKALNKSAASLSTVFVGGKKTKVKRPR